MAEHLPLNALRTFEAVASRLSFSAGAHALNVTPAAVSSQIRSLETQLGQPLFLRKGRKIALTDAGQALLPGVQAGLAQIGDALRALRMDREQGTLNVSMLASFLQKWLTPRLHEFYARHKDIDLRINADSAMVNFADSDFHAAVRFGRGDWPALKIDKLMDDWTVPVCSPALFDRYGPIGSIDELDRYPLINSRDITWNEWLDRVGGKLDHTRAPTFDDSVSVVAGAQQGLGLALTRWSLVAADVEAGLLTRPIDVATRSRYAYYFVAPAHYFDIPKVAVFRAWLIECCSAFRAPDSDTVGTEGRQEAASSSLLKKS